MPAESHVVALQSDPILALGSLPAADGYPERTVLFVAAPGQPPASYVLTGGAWEALATGGGQTVYTAPGGAKFTLAVDDDGQVVGVPYSEPEPPAPSLPRNVAVTDQGGNTARITWTAPASAGTTGPVIGYFVKHVENDLQEFTEDLAFTWPGLTGPASFTVQAMTGTVVGAESAAVAWPGTYAPPAGEPLSAPRDLAVQSVDADTATLTWTAPEHDGGIPITGYYVTLIDFDEIHYVTGLTFTRNGLSAPVQFAVSAGDENRSGPQAGPVTWTPAPPAATAPGAPTGVTAAEGNGQASVTWTAPASDGGSPVTGYVVTVVETGQTVPVGNVLVAQLDGLANGDTVTFTVAAVNAVGQGPASEQSAPVTPSDPAGQGGGDGEPTHAVLPESGPIDLAASYVAALSSSQQVAALDANNDRVGVEGEQRGISFDTEELYGTVDVSFDPPAGSNSQEVYFGTGDPGAALAKPAFFAYVVPQASYIMRPNGSTVAAGPGHGNAPYRTRMTWATGGKITVEVLNPDGSAKGVKMVYESGAAPATSRKGVLTISGGKIKEVLVEAEPPAPAAAVRSLEFTTMPDGPAPGDPWHYIFNPTPPGTISGGRYVTSNHYTRYVTDQPAGLRGTYLELDFDSNSIGQSQWSALALNAPGTNQDTDRFLLRWIPSAGFWSFVHTIGGTNAATDVLTAPAVGSSRTRCRLEILADGTVQLKVGAAAPVVVPGVVVPASWTAAGLGASAANHQFYSVGVGAL